jgi:osmotically-inducible protein OsmY
MEKKDNKQKIEDTTWDAKGNGSEIHVDVSHGHVTLSGVVDSEAKKMEAEKTAVNLEKGDHVDNKITVQRSDEDIKNAVAKAIRYNITIDYSRIHIDVDNAWVTLSGEVEYEYQKSKAKHLTMDVRGVKGVTDKLTVDPHHSHYKKTG